MLQKISRLSLIGAAALATLSTGCQQPKNAQAPKTAPGQLPSLATLNGKDTTSPTDIPKINATTYYAHAHLLEKQGNFAQAAIQYEQVLTLQPDFLAARNRLGVTMNKLGRHTEATACFQKCIAAQPNVAFLHNNLGFSYFLEGKYDQADASFRKALEIKPDFARARMNLAVNDARRNQFDAAYQEFAKVCSQADALYNVGILLVEAGRFGDAAQYLEGALAANPQFDAARKQLNEVARLSAQGDAGTAVAINTRTTMLTAAEPRNANATQVSYAGDPTESGATTFQPSIPVTQVNSTTSPPPNKALASTPPSTPMAAAAAPMTPVTTPPASNGGVTYPATIPVTQTTANSAAATPVKPEPEPVVYQPTIPVIVVPEKPAKAPPPAETKKSGN